MKQLFYIFFILYSRSLLTFLEPEELRDQYNENVIRYVTLNMGTIP